MTDLSERPRISVVTCTYNSERFLEENLASVWTDAPPFEQVIVDACSTDGTLDVVRRFQQKGCNIRVHQRPAAGIADAMNYGMRQAGGEVLQVLHSDDYVLDSGLYPRVGELFSDERTKWAYGLCRVVNTAGQAVGRQPINRFRAFRYWLLALANYVPHPAVFLHRCLLEEFGYFDESLKIIMDWDYWLRIGATHAPAVVEEDWCAFRIHDDSLSTREVFSSKLRAEEITVLTRHFAFPLSYALFGTHVLLYTARYLKNARLYHRGAAQ